MLWRDKCAPLKVAFSHYAGNWYKAAKACYEAFGIEVVEIRYTLTAEEIGLPADTDMKLVNESNPDLWGRIDWKLLEKNKSRLMGEAVSQMAKVDMLYLAGNSYEYFAGDVYTDPKGEMPDPARRKDPRIFAFRNEIEELMIGMAQERWLPFWGVCAAHQQVALMEGAKLQPYVNAALKNEMKKPELHKIDIPNPEGGKSIGYGDIPENAARIINYNLPQSFGDDMRLISMMQRQVHWTEMARAKCFLQLRPKWLRADIISQSVKNDDQAFLDINPPRYNAFHAMHEIEIKPGSMLEGFYRRAGISSNKSAVNSSHYQSIDAATINSDFVAAKSPEGIIEAIELPEKYAFGFFPLFHPETNVDGIAAAIISEKITYARYLNKKLGRSRQEVSESNRIPYTEFVDLKTEIRRGSPHILG